MKKKILIADAGATSTKWLYQFENAKNTVTSKGIHPFHINKDELTQLLKETVLPYLPTSPDKVFFYGAGIMEGKKTEFVKEALTEVFNAATLVYSDLLGAARAICGRDAGITCILGTGMNSCYYDGENISNHVPPLGYILGDEGSGAYLGKRFISDYLKKLVPSSIAADFEVFFQYSYQDIIENIYRKPFANRFLASACPFLKDNLSDQYVYDLVYSSFLNFFDRNVCLYPQFEKVPINFIGSVAFHFQPVLEKVCLDKKVQIGRVEKNALEGLGRYHMDE